MYGKVCATDWKSIKVCSVSSLEIRSRGRRSSCFELLSRYTFSKHRRLLSPIFVTGQMNFPGARSSSTYTDNKTRYSTSITQAANGRALSRKKMDRVAVRCDATRGGATRRDRDTSSFCRRKTMKGSNFRWNVGNCYRVSGVTLTGAEIATAFYERCRKEGNEFRSNGCSFIRSDCFIPLTLFKKKRFHLFRGYLNIFYTNLHDKSDDFKVEHPYFIVPCCF